MKAQATRAACFATACGLLIAIALSSSGHAATLSDSGATLYWGGLQNGSATTSDVIGETSSFQVLSADVNRVNVSAGGYADLEVVIHTNYNPASSGALGTGFGSLFIGTDLSKVNLNNSVANYAKDTFSADTDRFNYVFAIPTKPTLNTSAGVSKATGTGTGTLYALNGIGSDVQQSFYPTTATTAGSNFRNQQAVGYAGPTDPQYQLKTGSWSFDAAADTLKFLITGESGLFGLQFVIAWAMTCANDVILGTVQVDLPPPGGGGQVPLPAGFILTGSILLGAGGLARWRRQRASRVG